MLKSILLLSCSSILCSSPAVFAQTKLLSVTATLPAGVARKTVRLVVFVDGSYSRKSMFVDRDRRQ